MFRSSSVEGRWGRGGADGEGLGGLGAVHSVVQGVSCTRGLLHRLALTSVLEFYVSDLRGVGVTGVKMGLRSSLTRLPWIRYTLDIILYLTGNYFQ